MLVLEVNYLILPSLGTGKLFKFVNDTCGHQAGDELLILLPSQVRLVDVLARLGGDEFGLFLNQCSLKQALAVAIPCGRVFNHFDL